jgi:hypothetical protein
MVGCRSSFNSAQASLPGILRGGLLALRPASGANSPDTLIPTTTTTRWHLPAALRGGGLD